MPSRFFTFLFLFVLAGCSFRRESSALRDLLLSPTMQDFAEYPRTTTPDLEIQADLRPNSTQESDPGAGKSSLYRQLISVKCISNCTNDQLWGKCIEVGFNISGPTPADEVVFARDLKNHLLQWVETRTVGKTVPSTKTDSLGVVYSDDSQKVEVELQETVKGYCNGYEYILKR
jgi:hypothetical protein